MHEREPKRWRLRDTDTDTEGERHIAAHDLCGIEQEAPLIAEAFAETLAEDALSVGFVCTPHRYV